MFKVSDTYSGSISFEAFQFHSGKVYNVSTDIDNGKNKYMNKKILSNEMEVDPFHNVGLEMYIPVARCIR